MPWADMCFKYIKLLSSLILSNPNILSRFVHQWNEITRSKIKEVIFSKHRKCPQKIMVIQNNIFHTLLRFPSPIKLYISQFIRYSRKCGSCLDFLDRCLRLTRKLLIWWIPWRREFYGRHNDMVWNVCVTNHDHGYICISCAC